MRTDAEILQAVADDRATKGSEALYRDGFLSEYGRTTLENDFNGYAEMAFTRPERFVALAARYPRIEAKARLMVRFYQQVAPGVAMPELHGLSRVMDQGDTEERHP